MTRGTLTKSQSLFPALAVTSLALVAYLLLLDSLLEASSWPLDLEDSRGHAWVTRGTAVKQSLLAPSAVTSARAVGVSASMELSSTTTLVGKLSSSNVGATCAVR